MIASVRGLAVLAVLAILLGVAVLVGPTERASVDRSLAPGLAADAVTSISVTPVGAPAVRLVRDKDAWRWQSDRALAESATVDAIFSTLRGAHWHRRADTSVALPVTDELRLEGTKPLVLARGRDVPGAAQTWLVRGSDALLVDTWVATALFPAPLSLRVLHPLANAAQATAIEVKPLRIEGTHLVAPKDLWLDPSVVARLHAALAALEIVALPPSSPPPPSTMNATDLITVEGSLPAALSVTGTCDGGRVRVEATTGGGCVEQAAWQAVIDALAPLRAMGDDIADPHPLPIEPTQITFADGTVLSLASPPRIGDSDADRQRVEELVAILRTPGTRTARPTGTPSSTLTARDADGNEVVLELYDQPIRHALGHVIVDGLGRAIARRGEPGAIAVDVSKFAAIRRPPSALRDPVRWREDATTLSSLTVNGTTYTRGAVLGEWTRSPVGATASMGSAGSAGSAGPTGPSSPATVSVDDAALVDALADALAIVRAREETSTAPTALSIRVTFTPPAGAPRTHELALGAPTADGCPARIDGALVRADLELCTAAHALVGH